MSRKQSISQKKRYKNRTKKQELERVRKILKTKSLRMRDPKYAKAAHAKRVSGAKKQWDSKSKKEVAAISKKVSKSVKALYDDPDSVYNSDAYHQKLSRAWKKNEQMHLKNLDIGRKWDRHVKRRKKNISRSLRLFYRDLSDKDYEEWLNHVREGTQKAKVRRPNKTEAALDKLIRKFGFVYVGDKMFWIGKANPDFVNRRKKLVVELYGRHFHTNAKHDKERLHKIKKAGWKVLVIWDDLFRKNSERQIKRVEKFVSK